MSRVLIIIAIAVVLSGCAGADTTGARQSATAFAEAVSAADGQRACALLSDEVSAQLSESAKTSCAQALLTEDLPAPSPVRRAQRYGHQVLVTTGTDTLFLSEFPDGWKIIAAGCVPHTDKPYDCAVSKG